MPPRGAQPGVGVRSKGRKAICATVTGGRLCHRYVTTAATAPGPGPGPGPGPATADHSQFCIVGTYTRFSLRSQLQKVAIIPARSEDSARWVRYPLDLSREAPPNSVAGTFARGELTTSKLPSSGLGVGVPHAPIQVDHLCGLVAVRLFSGRHRNWIELGADCDHGHGGEFCDPLGHPSRPPIAGRRRTDHRTRPRADRERTRFCAGTEVKDAGWQLGTNVSAISIQKANRQPGI
jgi:hypothetical protein